MRKILWLVVIVLAVIFAYWGWSSEKEKGVPAQNEMVADEAEEGMMAPPTEVVPTAPVQTEPASTQAGVKEFMVEGKNFAFIPATLSVKKGDRVRIVFKNSGGKHDWKIDEFSAATKVINGGEQETIEFVADKTGSFEYYCSVGSHRAMGMKGTLTVTE